jgi:hypothetical protein
MAVMARNPTNTAAMKLRRAQEASKAMKDYETERLAIRAKTERLRAERLAREAIDPPKKKAKKIVVNQ